MSGTMNAAPLDYTNPTVRRSFIGASDAAVILGRSPYQTPLQLFEEKLGRREHKPTTYAQYLGHQKEQEAREAYEMERGVVANPAELVHPNHPWLIVHPDGLYQSGDTAVLVEYKYLGKAAFFDLTKAPLVPDMHRDQLYTQMLVAEATGLTKVVLDYVAFDGLHLHIIRVNPLPDYAFLLAKLVEFWDRMQRDDPPPFDPQRDVEQRNDDAWIGAAAAFKTARRNLEIAEAVVADAKKRLLALTNSRRTAGNGVMVTRFERRGPIDFAKVPELSAVVSLDDYLDTFRGPPTTVEKVVIERDLL